MRLRENLEVGVSNQLTRVGTGDAIVTPKKETYLYIIITWCCISLAVPRYLMLGVKDNSVLILLFAKMGLFAEESAVTGILEQ